MQLSILTSILQSRVRCAAQSVSWVRFNNNKSIQYGIIIIRSGVEDTKARSQGQGHKKILGQGQGHKKILGQRQPFRGQNFSRPRTGMLVAKAKDQGHRRKRSPPKKKVFKIFFQTISNLLAYPEFLIGGGLKHKSHEMTSSKFFQRGSFCGTKIS